MHGIGRSVSRECGALRVRILSLNGSHGVTVRLLLVLLLLLLLLVLLLLQCKTDETFETFALHRIAVEGETSRVGGQIDFGNGRSGGGGARGAHRHVVAWL